MNYFYKINKIFICIISLIMISVSCFCSPVKAMENEKIFDGEYYRIEQNDTQITLLDKISGESLIMNIVSPKEAILTLNDGHTKK